MICTGFWRVGTAPSDGLERAPDLPVGTSHSDKLARGCTIFPGRDWRDPSRTSAQTAARLPEREFERLGSSRTLRFDARLIAATNCDLEGMVVEKKFPRRSLPPVECFPRLHSPVARTAARHSHACPPFHLTADSSYAQTLRTVTLEVSVPFGVCGGEPRIPGHSGFEMATGLPPDFRPNWSSAGAGQPAQTLRRSGHRGHCGRERTRQTQAALVLFRRWLFSS